MGIKFIELYSVQLLPSGFDFWWYEDSSNIDIATILNLQYNDFDYTIDFLLGILISTAHAAKATLVMTFNRLHLHILATTWLDAKEDMPTKFKLWWTHTTHN